MSTRIDEVADRIFRISTFAEGMPLPFNQNLIAADEPLLFHQRRKATTSGGPLECRIALSAGSTNRLR